jgi:hypothetical protein
LNVNMEVWAVVSEFPKYEASSEGRVRNKQRKNILGGTVTPDGYIRLRLYEADGTSRSKIRSNIIAATFCVKESELHNTVDHLNRKRDDDRAINLKWETGSGQSLNKDHTVTINKYRPINQYEMNGNLLGKWRGIMDIEKELHISSNGVRKACKELGSYRNFIWRYHVEIIPGEEWRLAPYPEYEPMYVSTHGRIMIKTGKIVAGSDDSGYLRMDVAYKDSTQRAQIRKHIIICATFRGRNDDLTVNHEDKNRKNNHWENLTYMTIEDNIRHSYATGDNSNRLRKVNQYTWEGLYITQYSSLSEAARHNNNTPQNIYSACIGRSRTSGNFQWRYAD